MLLLFGVARMLWAYAHFGWSDQQDFYVYETASTLVQQHQSAQIYDQADNGQDPQLKLIDPHTVFAATARRIGVPEVRMYVYLPVLADLLLPFAGRPALRASHLWLACNIAMVVTTTFLMTAILGVSWSRREGIAIFLGLFSMFSVMIRV